MPKFKKALQPTEQQKFSGTIHGFDIETYDHNKKLLMVSLVCSDNTERVFFDRKLFFECLKKATIFKNSIIVATNLAFDFFGIFFETGEMQHFKTMFRGSQLIYAESYIVKDQFMYHPDYRDGKIRFIDTMNYAMYGVAKLGEIIKIPKLNVKQIIGQYPKSSDEWFSMIMYNCRDSEISRKFTMFLVNSFEELGATFKNTIASTALSLFKNKYLKDTYFRHNVDDLIDVFKAYYGGRCEVFKRGSIKDCKYYDINSLYPSVMHDFEFPDPNTHRVKIQPEISLIMQYEGVSEVIVEVPHDMKVPILPLKRDNGKVLFPVGTIRGSWTHVELRKAIEKGCKIIKTFKSHYYLKTCRPFKGFVENLYNLRKQMVKEGNPMELVVKIVMNSLYGKFGQKFIDIDNLLPMNLLTFEDLKKYEIIETIGDFVRMKEKFTEPMNYCIPIWACYVTGLGRLRLYEYLENNDPVYCDTDSIITNKDIKHSNNLGEMKLEMTIDKGIIVKPKFYALQGKKGSSDIEEIKIKGFSKAVNFLEIGGIELDLSERKKKFLNYVEFKQFLMNPSVRYNKFVKFKEALRRHFIPNEDILTPKRFVIDDDKRLWKGKFKIDMLESGRPVIMTLSE